MHIQIPPFRSLSMGVGVGWILAEAVLGCFCWDLLIQWRGGKLETLFLTLIQYSLFSTPCPFPSPSSEPPRSKKPQGPSGWDSFRKERLMNLAIGRKGIDFRTYTLNKSYRRSTINNILVQCNSSYGSCTCNNRFTWDLVRNVNSWANPWQLDHILWELKARVCVLTSITFGS